MPDPDFHYDFHRAEKPLDHPAAKRQTVNVEFDATTILVRTRSPSAMLIGDAFAFFSLLISALRAKIAVEVEGSEQSLGAEVV